MGDGRLQPDEATINEAIASEPTEAALLVARKQVLEMQQPVSFTPKPMLPDALTLALLEKIPFLANFLRSVDATGVSLSKLAYIQGNEVAGTVNSGFRIAGAVIAFIDFIRIPAMYLAAWLLDQPLSINLSQKAKWLYSAVVLSLSLAGLLAPTTIAPFIALAAASLAFMVSIFTLSKLFYDRHQTKQLLKQIRQEIEETEFELQQMIWLAKELGELLNTPDKKKNYLAYIEQVNQLQEDMDEKKETLQELYDNQLEAAQLLEGLGWHGVLDKTVGLGLATTALIGLTLSLFFPVIGLAIFGASAAGGCLYILARMACIAIPMIRDKWKSAQPNETPPQEVLETKSNLYQNEKAFLLQGASQVSLEPSLTIDPMGEALGKKVAGSTGLRLFDPNRNSKPQNVELPENNSECVL
ncbi:hypothetical protein [Legionella sp.]|uniref:hypothetical protein n=1 Tax=Legionella sp. TaxID=459 RepID=UPI00321FD08C